MNLVQFGTKLRLDLVQFTPIVSVTGAGPIKIGSDQVGTRLGLRLGLVRLIRDRIELGSNPVYLRIYI
jgi:hypothetical protein